MKNIIELTTWTFPVLAYDSRKDIGEEDAITVTTTDQMIQAAQLVGLSGEELVDMLCERQGVTAIEVGTPDKTVLTLDLDKLLEEHEERRQRAYLYGDGGCKDE